MTQVCFTPTRCAAGLLASVLVIFAAGCGGPSRSQRPQGASALAAAAAAAAERPVAMRGEGAFFNGEVEAALTVSRGFGRAMTRQQGRRLPEGFSQVYEFEPNEEEMKDAVTQMRMERATGAPLPPVTLRLRLRNPTKETVEIEILEVNSDLGNFAVRPAKISLAPDQASEAEPMNSRLGVTSDEIPVKVGLKYKGKSETQTILVKNLFTPEGRRKG